MKKFPIAKSRRIRSTSFSKRVESHGVKAYTVYNHMLLPTFFTSLEEEYHHLKQHVQLWDVSVQREIEISGSDSSELVQLMTCRDLSNAKPGICYYAPLVDLYGGLINDPLIYKLETNKWRVCIADSDVLLFAKGIAESRSLNVKIFEAKIDILAVQGPKSLKLMKKVFGEKISDLKFFRFDFFEFNNIKYLISRSGYSKQGGYEIHIENLEAGLDLYDHFFKIGSEFNLKPGAPNLIERIEGGLLSYGNDMDIGDNPLECGFDKYVNLESNIVFLGKENLIRIKKEGIKKKLMGVKIEGKSISLTEGKLMLNSNNQELGELRSAAYSPKFNKIVGIAMVKKDFCKINEKFQIKLDNSIVSGEICNLPII
ncbi:dimethylsulfoniopropionate demethylase [Pelagibacterales bacterium SAG-MED05]|nr:dimethylsulfoniopropionate demethylase [Pelagibacterales bacterium SAG-MED05]